MAYLDDKKIVTQKNSYSNCGGKIVLSKATPYSAYTQNASSTDTKCIKYYNSINSTYKYLCMPNHNFGYSSSSSFGNTIRSYSNNQLVHYNDYAGSRWYAYFEIMNNKPDNYGGFYWSSQSSCSYEVANSSYAVNINNVKFNVKIAKLNTNRNPATIISSTKTTILNNVQLGSLTQQTLATALNNNGYGTINMINFDTYGFSFGLKCYKNGTYTDYYGWISDTLIKFTGSSQVAYYPYVHVTITGNLGNAYPTISHPSQTDINNNCSHYLRILNGSTTLFSVNIGNSDTSEHYAKLNSA